MPEIAAARAAILRHPARLVGAALLTFLVLAAVVGPGLVYLWNGSDYRSQDLVNTLANPSSLHPLGTDALGRDALARLLYGCRISLLVGTVSTAVSLLIGVAYGGLAGYAGGRIDGVMMRLLDGFFSIPLVILVAVLFALFGRSFLLLLVALGATSWLTMARVVRGQVLALRHEPFIDAARTFGASISSILLRHIAPNLIGPIMVCASFTVPSVMLGEAYLSFLGLGVPPPSSSIGVLAQEGAAAIALRPVLLIAPAVVFAALLYGLTQISEILREILGYEPEGANLW